MQAAPGALLPAHHTDTGKACRASVCTVHAGTKGATLKSDDSMEEVLHVMDHDSVLFFTQVTPGAWAGSMLPLHCCSAATHASLGL